MKLVKARHWTVRGPLKIVKRVTVQRREYVLLKTEPYITKYGHASEILAWEGCCVVCGSKFRFTTPRSKFEPTATCKKHRRGQT